MLRAPASLACFTVCWLTFLFGSASTATPNNQATASPDVGNPDVGNPDASDQAASVVQLDWTALPDLPDELGVAGPFVGVHQDCLIVAGGTNFAQPVWERPKQWRDSVYVLEQGPNGFSWKTVGTLPHPMGYGAAVSTPDGVLCLGGNDADTTFDTVFLLSWNRAEDRLERVDFPRLPSPCAYGQAALIGTTVYLAGGQSGAGLETAMNNFWSLDLAARNQPAEFRWQQLPTWSDTPRAFNITTRQHNGYDDCVYVIGGRWQNGTHPEFLSDVWEYRPGYQQWRQRKSAPHNISAGTGIGFGQSHIFVLGGDSGELFAQTDSLRDQHPGFRREAWSYHTITDRWSSLGTTPDNQVTTLPVMWQGRIVIASGEIRPRVRTPHVWSLAPRPSSSSFGWLNYAVLVGYLLTMVGIGVYFARFNKSTDDYFRGGKSIPWWAAGCSIFATMLSSLTFTGLPSKAYAQDWVYTVSNLMIPVVAVVAVYVALPFYRRIDATSAYEYLEKRFSLSVRLFGSASFTCFQLFRMALVLSLTGMALAVATPLTPAQSVWLMGLLSILYCTLGGIEAVIWTDTLQTVVLMGGALLALVLLLAGAEGGPLEMFEAAQAANKLRVANLNWEGTGAQLALWVIVLGALGQHLTSYTADQAVVQRYMTTSSQAQAARSIWTNAVLTLPATVLFFGIGTALFLYYQAHPQRLDPTITTDQIFPLFISREMPVGLAGLVVAGIFSAAQSTISTSMNSMATTIVTDFMRPFQVCRQESHYLSFARFLTLLSGVLGTLLGLLFIDPNITSLFDTFIKVVGLFMGVLGGLFLLGVLTRRANARGALIGACLGASAMIWMFLATRVNGYLYIPIGMATCFVAGYAASWLSTSNRDLAGLTLLTIPYDR